MIGGFGLPSWDDDKTIKGRVGFILFCGVIGLAFVVYPFAKVIDKFRKPENRQF